MRVVFLVVFAALELFCHFVFDRRHMHIHIKPPIPHRHSHKVMGHNVFNEGKKNDYRTCMRIWKSPLLPYTHIAGPTYLCAACFPWSSKKVNTDFVRKSRQTCLYQIQRRKKHTHTFSQFKPKDPLELQLKMKLFLLTRRRLSQAQAKQYMNDIFVQPKYTNTCDVNTNSLGLAYSFSHLLSLSMRSGVTFVLAGEKQFL